MTPSLKRPFRTESTTNPAPVKRGPVACPSCNSVSGKVQTVSTAIGVRRIKRVQFICARCEHRWSVETIIDPAAARRPV